VDIIG